MQEKGIMKMRIRSLLYESVNWYIWATKAIYGKRFTERFRTIAGLVNGDTVFEPGCGPALLSDYITPGRYIGMDLNEKFIRYAVKKRRNCVIGNVFTETLPAADTAVIIDFLHHITPREDMLLEILKRTYAKLIVLEPAAAYRVRLPKAILVLVDILFGDNDGINRTRDRMKWKFSPEALMIYFRQKGATHTEVLGKEVLAVFERYRSATQGA
jgi:hypothetical protein